MIEKLNTMRGKRKRKDSGLRKMRSMAWQRRQVAILNTLVRISLMIRLRSEEKTGVNVNPEGAMKKHREQEDKRPKTV